MIFVDSSVWIDYFNGVSSEASDLLNLHLGRDMLITGDIVLTEVLQGFTRDDDFEEAKRLLTSFEIHQVTNPVISIKSAENYRFLRKKGITIRKTIDTLIATHCIENNLTLLHADRDFLPFATHLELDVLPGISN